jgi:hypothetical protein
MKSSTVRIFWASSLFSGTPQKFVHIDDQVDGIEAVELQIGEEIGAGMDLILFDFELLDEDLFEFLHNMCFSHSFPSCSF